MPIGSISSLPASTQLMQARAPEQAAPAKDATREVFDDFVGQTFYGQMLGAMRQSQKKPAYFHGGRAEEVFQQQLDQILAESMTKAGVDSLAGPMFELFNLKRG